jgi:hypothetical protein
MRTIRVNQALRHWLTPKISKAHPNQTKNSLLSVLKSLIFTEFLFKTKITQNYLKEYEDLFLHTHIVNMLNNCGANLEI